LVKNTIIIVSGSPEDYTEKYFVAKNSPSLPKIVGLIPRMWPALIKYQEISSLLCG